MMMATSVYAENMAKALFEAAIKEKNLIRQLGNLRMVSDLVKDPSIASALTKSGSSFEEKSRILKDRAGDLSLQVLNLVGMLLEKGRLADLDDISVEYQRLIDSYHGVEGAEVAEVATAIPLDEEDKLRLGKRISEMLGRPVVLKVVVTPELLGGVVVRVGDKIIDGSVLHRLQTLSKELVQ
jgi:F-type H+-transporting ATPase subunit delta